MEGKFDRGGAGAGVATLVVVVSVRQDDGKVKDTIDEQGINSLGKPGWPVAVIADASLPSSHFEFSYPRSNEYSKGHGTCHSAHK